MDKQIIPDVVDFLDRFLGLIRGRELHANQPVYDEVIELRKRCLSAQTATLEPLTMSELLELESALGMRIELKQSAIKACPPSLLAEKLGAELEQLKLLEAKVHQHTIASCK